MKYQLAIQIKEEQRHGRQKYGRGPDDLAHDDAHTHEQWRQMIKQHLDFLPDLTPQEYRQRLVKIAGLAVSAIESFDRKTSA